METTTLKYMLIPAAAAVSAAAQIFLKKTSMCTAWKSEWFLWLGCSGTLYVAAMFLYMYLLRRFPVSKIYPVLTILVIIAVNIYGYFIREPVSLKHIAGISVGILSMYLLLH